jgi:hypothetical protein
MKVLNCRGILLADERVSDFPEYSFRRAAVDVNIGSGEVAQRLERAAIDGFEDVPYLPVRQKTVRGNRQTQFEAHVQARGGRFCGV